LVKEFREWNPQVEDELWDRGINCLETCSKYVAEMRPECAIRALEPKFEFTLGRPDIKAKFLGYIDCITENGEIWDWKTGSVREEAEIVQGSVYMKGYQKLYGEPPEKIRFVYLKEGKVRGLEPNDENWNEMIRHAKSLCQDIQRDQFDPDPEESKCYWCDYQGYCSASANGAGGIDYTGYKRRRAKF